MKNIIYQQGDVILKKCGNFKQFKVNHRVIPSTAKKVPGNLVLKGQTNSHALYGGKFELYRENNVLYVKVTKATTLDHVQDHKVKKPLHAEHHAQVIAPGEYFLDNVMEYDHMLEEARVIID